MDKRTILIAGMGTPPAVLTETVWAQERVEGAYKKRLSDTGRLVKARFVEMHLPGDKLRAFNIIVPPLQDQREFAEFVSQAEKAKESQKESLAKLTAAQKALMNFSFTKARGHLGLAEL